MGRQAEDLTGQTFGLLTVLRRATEEEWPRKSGRHARWLCKCSCGKLKFVSSNKLKDGTTISCGCQKRTAPKQNHYNINQYYFEDLTGKKFNKLTVISLLEKRGKNYIWNCQCECGNITEVSSTNLKSGHTKSCGCLKDWSKQRPSNGEETIIKLLQQSQISFEREKQMPDMKKHGHHLRFDFYLPKQNIAIEYNGEPHYQFIPFFHKTTQDFQKRQEYDRYKIGYCLSHGITLYIIPYWELDSIHTAADLFQPRFRAISRWKNDEDWRRRQNLTKSR